MFHLPVLVFHFGLLLGQKNGFFLQLFVLFLELFLLAAEKFFGSLERGGLLLEPLVGRGELFLLRLKFFCKCLRLFEQLFGTHRRRNRVQSDTDGFGELIEERKVNVAEMLERRQFADGFHFAFEQDREHDHVERSRPHPGRS